MERRVLTELRGAKEAFDWLLAGKPQPVYFDIETTGLNPFESRFVTWAFHVAGRGTVVVDLRHWLNLVPLKSMIVPIFDGSRLVVGHNLKFDLGFMQERMKIRALRVYDTLLAEQIIAGLGNTEADDIGYGLNLKAVAARRRIEVSKEERNWFVDLDKRVETKEVRRWEPSVREEFYQYKPTDRYIDKYGKFWVCAPGLAEYKPWDQPLPKEQIDYICQDVEILPPILADQLEKLRKYKLMDVASLEFRALPSTVDLELNGMYFNVPGWREILAEKEAEAAELGNEVMKTFIPLICAGLDAKYKPIRAEWCAWRDRKEEYEAEAKNFYHGEVYKDLSFPQVEEGEKWGKYKVRAMHAWREANKEPKKPPRELPAPNLGSPQQVLMAIQGLGVPVESTQSRFLEPYQERYPEVKLLIRWRKAHKFGTSFGENLLSQGIPFEFNGVPFVRIHASWKQIGASTGRRSVERPALQQIPARGPDGKRMRSMIQARPGHKLLTADFSNIELRILAELSEDPVMIRLFNEGKDLHAETARFMFKLAPDADVKQLVPGLKLTYRDVAKAINFGLMYGMSAHRLRDILKCSLEEAQDLLDRYFEFYQGVRRWLDASNAQVLRDMVSRTRLGSWRKFSLPDPPIPQPGEKWEEFRKREGAWKGLKSRIARQGTNHKVQGLSAIITKEAEAMIAAVRPEEFRITAVVHDEIVMEVPDKLVETGKAFLAGHMWNACVKYLKLVKIPPIEVVASDHWQKE